MRPFGIVVICLVTMGSALLVAVEGYALVQDHKIKALSEPSYMWVVVIYGDQGPLQGWRSESQPKYSAYDGALSFQDAQTGYQVDVSGNFVMTRVPGGIKT